MARATSKIRGNSWRILIGSVALGAASLTIVGGAYAATASTDDSSGTTAVVECSSGTITRGDVQTSSLYVAKVPASAIPDIPGGCTVRTN